MSAWSRTAPRQRPSTQAAAAHAEPAFTRAQALRTPAFWLLSLFTLLAYPVQAGVSLHQAPFLIERGLSPAIAAAIVSTFSMMSGVSSLGFGFYPRRLPVRFALALVGGAAVRQHAGHADGACAADRVPGAPRCSGWASAGC